MHKAKHRPARRELLSRYGHVISWQRVCQLARTDLEVILRGERVTHRFS